MFPLYFVYLGHMHLLFFPEVRYFIQNWKHHVASWKIRGENLSSGPMCKIIGLQDKTHFVIGNTIIHTIRFLTTFILISSKQECWQCICSRYLQQNALLILISGKNGNSSICESGRLQALLNQAYQFHTDFYHRISITWLSAPNLFFWPKQLARQNLRTITFSSQQSHCLWTYM